MRWKFIFAIPVICSTVAVAIWLLAIFVILQHSRQTHSEIMVFVVISALSPFVWGSIGAWFAYRHTANRRKLHALVVLLLSVCLTVVAYKVIDRRWHDQLFFDIMTVPDSL